MKKQSVLSKRRPRQNIISMILNSAKLKQRSSGSASTPSTTPTTRSSSSRSTRKSNLLIASAAELTRRSKNTVRRQSGKRSILLKGSRAFYRGPKGIEKVTVVGVHHDAKLEPYYTIKFRDGKEKQMDGKRLTPINDNNEPSSSINRRGSVPTDQCSCSSSEHENSIEKKEENGMFQKGQDAYYRSSSGEGVRKVTIVEKATSNKYSVVLNDGSIREIERNNLVRLIDLTSKELACLMKEKNERHASTPKQYSSMQSKESKHTFDQGYEPEAEPSSSENSYENNIKISPADTNENTVLALPCAVEMVEAKTEEGGTKLVPMYKAEMDVYYRGPQGIQVAHILKTHLDDLLEPYYTIRLKDGREKQTDNAHISLEKSEEKVEEESENNPAEADVEVDDWYREWKESQVKEDQALRDDIKQFEDQNNTALVEESTKSSVQDQPSTPTPEQSPLIPTPESRRIEQSGPDPNVNALVIKNLDQQEAEKSERIDSSVETMAQIKKQDPDDCFAIVQAPQFNVGDSVLYNSSKGDHMRATITKIRKDEKHRPYFVIKLSSGDEKKVYGHRLTPVRRERDDKDRRESSRTRSPNRSCPRRDREQASAGSRRSSSLSRDCSTDRSRSSIERRTSMERSRSMSRPPKEHRSLSRGGRAESRDPRGRVHPVKSKESRSRSKSVRATSRDISSRDSSSRDGGSEHRQRARSRSRTIEDSSVRKSSASSRKAPMVMGVSHRVQHIGENEGSSVRSRASSVTSRFGRIKSSISSGIMKVKQRSFDCTV